MAETHDHFDFESEDRGKHHVEVDYFGIKGDPAIFLELNAHLESKTLHNSLIQMDPEEAIKVGKALIRAAEMARLTEFANR